MDIGFLLLRLTVGLTLAAHGAQKLFGWFGGPGLDGTGVFFEKLGFLPGRRHALMAGLAEAGGGLFLALGLVTPFAAAVVLAVMLVAAVTVHLKQGFFLTTGGYEYTLILGAAGLSLAFTGPGSLSLDALLGFDQGGALWGGMALLVGLAAGAIQIAGQRRTASTHAVAARLDAVKS
jgi:putative oxidoreductase